MWRAIAIAALAGLRAGAADVQWDPNAAAAGVQGGTGTWNTSLANWNNAGAQVVWFNSHGDNAIFGGTAGGSVSVNSAVTANLLQFDVAGYSLVGSQTVTVPSVIANVDAIIADPIASTLGLTKSGAGVLTLSGANPSMRGLTLQQGPVAFAVDGNLGSNTSSIVFGGGTLRYAGTTAYSLGSGRTVRVDPAGGQLDVASGSFAMNTAGRLTGTGTLTKIGPQTLTIGAANAAFAGALEVAAGTTVLTATGAVNARPITLSGGSLLLKSDSPADFQSNVTVTADSTFDVDRVSTRGMTVGTHAIGDLTVKAGARLSLPGNANGNYSTVRNLDLSGGLSITGSAVRVTGDYSAGGGGGGGAITFGHVFQFPELFTGGLLFVNGRAQTVANPVSTDDVSGGDAVIGASGVGTAVTYTGAWAGGGAGTANYIVLRDGARFVMGPGARVNTLTAGFASSRPFTVIGNGTANSFELDAAFAADHTVGGTVADGFTSLEVRDATLVTRASQSLPAVIKKVGVGGSMWMGSITLSGTAGASWNVTTADQQYAGGVTIASSAAIVADRNLTHNGFAAGKFDAQFQIPTSGATLTKQGAGTLTLAGNQGYAPGSRISVEAGVLRFSADPGAGWYAGNYTRGADGNVTAPPAPAGTLAVGVSGGSVEFAAPVSRIDSLELTAGGGAARVNAAASSGDRVLVLHTLAAGNAALDITNNRAVFDYDAGAASPLAAVAALVKSGLNPGGLAWQGAGINSSTAAADSTLAIGYGEAADVLHLTGGQMGIFGPATVDATSVLVRLTHSGDANLDGVVDFADFQRLERAFGQTGRGWSGGDFNYDGVVDTADFKLLCGNYDLAAGAPPLAMLATLPEPGGLMFVATAAAGLLARRRRSRQAITA